MDTRPVFKILTSALVASLLCGFLAAMAQILLIAELAVYNLPFESFDMEIGIVIFGILGLCAGFLLGCVLGLVWILASMATHSMRKLAFAITATVSIATSVTLILSGRVLLSVVWAEEGHKLIHFINLAIDAYLTAMIILVLFGVSLAAVMLWSLWSGSWDDEALPENVA